MTNNNLHNSTRNLFLDNTVGNITAETLRTFIDNIFNNSEVVIKKFKTLSAFESGDTSSVFENSIVLITQDEDQNNNGVYTAKVNQPTSREFLTQVSNNINPKTLTKTSYEFNSGKDQYLFLGLKYKDNLVDVFVDGIKIRPSQITINSASGINGTSVTLHTPLSSGREVEIVCYSE